MLRPRIPIRLTALAVILVLLMAACGDDDDDASPERSTSTTAGETTTTTVAATGPTEWVDEVRDLYERRFDLLADPDRERVGQVYADTCDCWESSLSVVETLANNGHHIEGQPTSVLFVAHEQTDPAGFVYLTVKIQASPLREVDANGELIEEYPAPAEPTCVSLALLPDGPDEAYRLHTELPLTGCPPESEP